MTQTVPAILILSVILNFVALGSSNLRSLIRAVAIQGFLLAVFPLAFVAHASPVRLYLLVAVSASVKGFLIPATLFRALREVHIRHEAEPYLGLVPSVLLCAIGTGLALLFAGNLPLAGEHRGLLVVPTALSTFLTGFLLLTTRRKAISQVTGYLTLENGIFVFAQLLHEAMPFLVEVGVLLDLVVGIFVMGIVMNHIQREFSSLDTERLSELRD
jgi:hydrogenase-4 component E